MWLQVKLFDGVKVYHYLTNQMLCSITRNHIRAIFWKRNPLGQFDKDQEAKDQVVKSEPDQTALAQPASEPALQFESPG